MRSLEEAQFFSRRPALVLADNVFYLLRNPPPPSLLQHWREQPKVPVGKLSHRLLMHLRKTQSANGVNWEQLCVAHPAASSGGGSCFRGRGERQLEHHFTFVHASRVPEPELQVERFR